MNIKLFSLRLRQIAVIVITLLFTGSIAFGKPLIDKYNLKYRIDFKGLKLFCKAELSLNNVRQNDTLDLLLYRLLRVKSVKDEFGNIIIFNQTIKSFSDWDLMQANCITIFTGEIKPTEITKKVILEYEGYLVGYTETGMSYVKDNIDPSFTILRMDCFAYPVPSKPSFAGLKELRQNFDYKISIEVPDSLTVINGGKLIAKNKFNGTTEYIYQNIKPACRIDIAIAKYSTLVEKGFFVHYFPEDSTGAKSLSEAVRKVYTLYTTWFGEGQFSGYSIIEIPDGWGSQTDVTCILQTASAFKDEKRLYELYHEIFHTWDISSNDKYPCRLESEGLATFVQYLAAEKTGDQTVSLDESAAKIFKKVKEKLSKNEAASNTPIIDFGLKQLTDLSYTKGMLFFYLVYKEGGEVAFTEAIKDYYKTYRKTGATTKEFSDFLITKLKSKKVESLVNEWIYTSVSSQKILNNKSIENLID
ncbi:MAG: M1 family aminopeptidase [Bacteroidetes bacterium]|nr:M1 family aminopeptidase [Bacteroidota bacterium]